jgi:hypothetical protein
MADTKKKGFLPSSSKIVNITPKITDKNISLKAEQGYFELNYYKNRNHFQDLPTFSKFIRGVEKIVRTSDEYKAYKSYLMSEIGLDHCAVMQSVTEEKATVEMHHGPILTLYDYCAIVLDSFLANGELVSSFNVAKTVLEEHFNNNVQVVMLSKTAHQLVHTGKIFIHPDQAWGNLNNFLGKYSDGLSSEQIVTINEYIDRAKLLGGSTDNGYLKAEKTSNWNKRGIDLLDEDEIE